MPSIDIPGTCPALRLTWQQLAVLWRLAASKLLHSREPNEIIQDGLSLQPVGGAGLDAMVHLKFKHLRVRMIVRNQQITDLEVLVDPNLHMVTPAEREALEQVVVKATL
jgi:hypothetical protein